jgi:hypothetical protein
MMNKKICIFHFQIRNCFPFLKAYFAKYKTLIHSPYHHIQRLQWIKLHIQVLSVEMKWDLIQGHLKNTTRIKSRLHMHTNTTNNKI